MAIRVNNARVFALLVALALSAPAAIADGVRINDIVVAPAVPAAQREATLKAVRAFYDFSDTADEAYLQQAIAKDFTARSLPPGRPQGPDVPAFASLHLRAPLPALT